jgi:Flp pilus assembly protein TadB
VLTPKYPKPDTAPTPVVITPADTTAAPAPIADHAPVSVPVAAPVPASGRPTVQLTPGALITVAAGGTAAVLVIGTVLVSMLLAVSITAVSVALCAVVLRSLLNSQNKKH